MKREKSEPLKAQGQGKKKSFGAHKNDSHKFQGKMLLSIDIGQHTTKLLLGRAMKTSAEIKRACTFRTPRGSVENGRILDPSLLADKLSTVIKAEGLSAKLVFCTVENADIVTREIVLPTTDETAMQNMLTFEVQQYMPIELEDYTIQFKMLDTFEENGDKKTRFLATAMPKVLAQSYFDLLQKVGLKAAVLDIHSNSIDKLAWTESKVKTDLAVSEGQSIAIVDLGYNHLNIVLLADGVYQFNRYIPQGASSIDRNLMSFFNYTEEEIEQKKCAVDLSIVPSAAEALTTDLSVELLREANIVKNVLDNWINELERVFKYYGSRSKGSVVQKIIIHGGTAQMKGLDKYLSKVLNVPVECVSKLTSVQFQESNTQNMTPFMNAMGALIRR